MSGIFDSLFGGGDNKGPSPEEQAAATQRQLAEQRAQADRIRSAQSQLTVETESNRSDELGARSLLGPLGALTTRLGAG